jgi:NADH:ubiquinone oxidoreductase subunit 6 (subunit J)
MTKFFIHAGGAIVLGGSLLLSGLVLLSDMSILGKGSVLGLCLAVVAFVIFSTAAHQTVQTSGTRNYERLALMSWLVGAAAMAFLIIAAFTGLL